VAVASNIRLGHGPAKPFRYNTYKITVRGAESLNMYSIQLRDQLPDESLGRVYQKSQFSPPF